MQNTRDIRSTAEWEQLSEDEDLVMKVFADNIDAMEKAIAKSDDYSLATSMLTVLLGGIDKEYMNRYQQ